MREIFYNGAILTMEERDARMAVRNAPEAVMIEKGVILKVGALKDLMHMAGNKAKYHDLKGRCLMPAFIDAHSHFVMNARMSLCTDLSGCKSFEDIVKTLKWYINENHVTEKNAVIGFGYDHNFLEEGAHPDKRILDKASKKIPILILHISGHLGCASSAALKMAGIDVETQEPQGGRIGRLEGGMEPSGYLEESSLMLVEKIVGDRIKKNIRRLIKDMQAPYLQCGITTVQDGATTAQDFKLLRILSKLHLLKLDVVAYPLMTAGGRSLMRKYGDMYHEYRSNLKIGGYKLILDGSPQGKTAWLSKPYMDSGDYRGYEWLSNDAVEKYVKVAVNERKQILAHCNGDAASEQFLNAYEKAALRTKRKEDLRPVMIHCQTVRRDQIARMAELRMMASIFIGHVWYWGDVHIVNLGSDRGSRISPVRNALEKGVVVTFHQDTPVTKPDMLHSVWCAVNRVSRNGKAIGEKEKISVYDALKAVTVNAAYQYFEENQKGTIKEGKMADFVVLESSPLEVEPMDIRNIAVMETIKNGKVIYRNNNEMYRQPL